MYIAENKELSEIEFTFCKCTKGKDRGVIFLE